MPQSGADMFSKHGVVFVNKKKRIAFIKTKIPTQDNLVALLAQSGVRGLVRVPHEQAECERIHKKYDGFVRDRNKRIREMIADRTADEDVQDEVYEALMTLIRHRP
jgi:hypothetical protein